MHDGTTRLHAKLLNDGIVWIAPRCNTRAPVTEEADGTDIWTI